jgi:hypothetical protein
MSILKKPEDTGREKTERMNNQEDKSITKPAENKKDDAVKTIPNKILRAILNRVSQSLSRPSETALT